MNHATDRAPAGIEPGYRMGFTVGEHSVRHIRRILRVFLSRWDLTGLAEAAGLALSELVTNVVRHVPGRRCTVLIMRRPDGLRVEVTDGCAGPLSPGGGSAVADVLAEGGRGLVLVAAVTDRWGVEPVPGGKTVWFECDT